MHECLHVHVYACVLNNCSEIVTFQGKTDHSLKSYLPKLIKYPTPPEDPIQTI